MYPCSILHQTEFSHPKIEAKCDNALPVHVNLPIPHKAEMHTLGKTAVLKGFLSNKPSITDLKRFVIFPQH